MYSVDMGVLPQGIQESRGTWETVNTHIGQISEFLQHTLPFFKINGATTYILCYECTFSGMCLIVLDSEDLKEKSCRGLTMPSITGVPSHLCSAGSKNGRNTTQLLKRMNQPNPWYPEEISKTKGNRVCCNVFSPHLPFLQSFGPMNIELLSGP